MGKISFEELEKAGRIDTVSVLDYQIVKYRVPAGRSGNFYIRVFQNNVICKNTASSLLEVASKLNLPDISYSDNYNNFGDNIIKYVQQQETEKKARQKEIEQMQLKAAKESAILTQQTAIKTLQHPHISDDNKKLLQSQIKNVSQATMIESLRSEQQVLEKFLTKVDAENEAAQEKAETAERERQVEIARQKAEKMRQDKLSLNLEELYKNYQLSVTEEREVKTLSENLKILRQQNKLENKRSFQAMVSMLAVLVVGVFGGSNVYANQQALKEARVNLVKIEKKVQDSKKGYVSDQLKNKIHDELEDTEKIHNQNNRNEILEETKRLKKLDGTAVVENKVVNQLVRKLNDLSEVELTSSADKKSLMDLAEQKKDYETLNFYKKQASQLLNLVAAHNLRN